MEVAKGTAAIGKLEDNGRVAGCFTTLLWDGDADDVARLSSISNVNLDSRFFASLHILSDYPLSLSLLFACRPARSSRSDEDFRMPKLGLPLSRCRRLPALSTPAFRSFSLSTSTRTRPSSVVSSPPYFSFLPLSSRTMTTSNGNGNGSGLRPFPNGV